MALALQRCERLDDPVLAATKRIRRIAQERWYGPLGKGLPG